MLTDQMDVKAGQIRHPLRAIAAHTHPVLAKFLRDRGPHLAAMVAYYALLSLVPFVFLAVSLLGFIDVSASSELVRELHHLLPGQSVSDILNTVHSIQNNAGTLGIIGLVGLVWTSLGFYSALESAMNIVFSVQNRAFFHQKGVTFVLLLASLVTLFASIVLSTAATAWVDRHVHHLINFQAGDFVVSLVLTSLGAFLFLGAVYRYLTNVELDRGDVWPGALAGTVLFQISIQALPLYLRFSGQVLALRAFGGLVILLVWLYLMANIIILGAEINWWRWVRRQPETPDDLAGLA
jgi:membrane protein